MKRETLLFVAVTMLSCSAQAWEFSRNPDRFPSLGLHVINGSVKGDRYETDLPGTVGSRSQSGPESESTYTLGADIKLPINHGMTLGFFYDQHEIDRVYKRNRAPTNTTGEVIFKETSNLNGYRYGFDFRLYLNK